MTDTAYTNLVVKTTLVPEEALGAFIGENPNGVWILTVADQTTADGGNLAKSWTTALALGGLAGAGTGSIAEITADAGVVAAQRRKLGPLSRGERNVLVAFLLAVTGWVGPGIVTAALAWGSRSNFTRI